MSDRRTRNAPVLSERRVPADERRAAPRYLTQGTAAVIGWSEGEEHQTVPATLVDISMGGFSAWVRSSRPAAYPSGFASTERTRSPWLKASVVATSTKGFLFWTRRQVRLRFLETCTYDFFKAAIDGFTQEYQHRDETFEGFDGRYWR